MVFKKPNFGPPPEGYIAGLGRGATGFITRGDIGPSKINQQTFTEIKGAPPGLGRGKGAPTAPKEDGPVNDAQFDAWDGFEGNHMGGNTSLFDPVNDPQRNMQINKEEKEADD